MMYFFAYLLAGLVVSFTIGGNRPIWPNEILFQLTWPIQLLIKLTK